MVINYNDIDEKYRTEYYKKERKEKREAAERFIRSLLNDEVDSLIKKIGIKDEDISNLLNKEEGAAEYFVKCLSETTKITGLSKEYITYFRMSCRDDADMQNVYNNLRDELAYECEIKIAKKAKLYPNTWSRFLDNEKGTTENTVRKIEEAFELEPHECELLESKILKDTFLMSEELSELSKNYLEDLVKTTLGKESFLKSDIIKILEEKADLTKSVLETIETTDSKIKQNTLLKLIVAFGLNDKESNAYMEVAGSGFYRKLDVIFLSCIACGYTDPHTVSAIIDRFKNEKKMKNLTNPYKPSFFSSSNP